MNVTFPKAEIVKFIGLTHRDGIDTYDYNRIPTMFPAIRSLNIHNVNLTKSLNHIPHMESLAIQSVTWNSDLFPYLYNSTLKDLEQTLKNNPQIRHIEIDNLCTWYTIEMIAKILPMLETLEVTDINYYSNFYIEDSGSFNNGYAGETIRFKNMKKFKFINSRVIDHRTPREFLEQNPLKFGNLEEIQFDGEIGIKNWIQIALENPNLKSFDTSVQLNDEQLQEIAGGLPNLEQFKMQFRIFDEHIDDVIQFMQKAKHLKKATFVLIHKKNCESITKHMANEWKIEKNDGISCFFVRFTHWSGYRK